MMKPLRNGLLSLGEEDTDPGRYGIVVTVTVIGIGVGIGIGILAVIRIAIIAPPIGRGHAVYMLRAYGVAKAACVLCCAVLFCAVLCSSEKSSRVRTIKHPSGVCCMYRCWTECWWC